MAGIVTRSDVDYLADRIVMSGGGCWLWTGSLNHYGYGVIPGKPARYAHRVAYETWAGPIPAGLTIDHLCRVRRCVNPHHMEPVTRGENRRRAPLSGVCAENATRETCQEGHPFDGHNGVQRTCSTCARRRRQEWARKKRALATPEALAAAEHGRMYTYQVYGCRCDECRAAKREYRKALA